MKATTRRRAMIVGAVALVASGAAWGVGSRGGDAEGIVRRGDIEARVVAPGTVEAVGGA